MQQSEVQLRYSITDLNCNQGDQPHLREKQVC